MLGAIWQVLLELAPWLLVGTAVAGLLHVLVPKSLVRRQLTGRWAAARAVVVGVPMPLCSCGVIPAGLGLKKDGASDGAAIGFLISTPQTGVDSILVSASFLGWPFALFKVAAAAVTGVAGGMLTDRFGAAGRERAELPQPAADRQERRTRLAEGWTHGIQLLRSIWRWLVFGIVVSAAIGVFVPPDALAGFGRLGSLGAALAVLAVSLPLYVCATASVPIAAALVASGMPTGAALVFLMAGPATNVATIGAVFRGFGRRALAVYLATIIVGSVGFGVLFDFVLSGDAAAGMAHAHRPAWWATASALALVALLAYFAAEDLRRLAGRRLAARGMLPAELQAGEAAAAGADGNGRVDGVREVAVEGMVCGGCVNRLESALRQTRGVSAAEVTLEPGRAVVHGTIGDSELRAAIEAAGYQPR